MSYDSTITSLSPTYRWKLDESSGSTAADSIASNDGTIGAGVTLAQSSLPQDNGRSMSFDGGTTSYIETSTGVTTDDAFSVCLWASTLSSAGQTLVSQKDGTGTGRGLLFLKPTNLLGTFYGQTTALDTALTYSDGVTRCYALTFTGGAGGTLSLYCDGELKGTTTETGEGATGELVIGAGKGLTTGNLDGRIDDVAFWQGKVLSQAEIRSIYSAGKPPKLTYQADLSASAVSALISDGVVDFGTHSLTSAQNSAVFSTSTSSTGADVWFSSDEDGSTPIAADIYYWDDASSVFKAKVAAGALSSVTGGTIYLHVGNKPGGVSGDPYPVTAEGVYPLADSLNDQSSNGNNLTASGGLTVGSGGSGPDGNMPSTDFTSASSQVAYAAISGGGAATVSGWFNSDTDSTRALFSWANFASNSNYLTARAAGSSAGDPVDAASRNPTLNNVETTTGYTVGTWHHFAMKIDSSGNLDVFIDGGSKGSASGQALTTGLDNFEIGALGRSSTHAESAVFDGELAMFRADSTDRSDAEINLDYLLEGPNASTYWTVSNLTTLPDFTFELRSDREVVLSGSTVTSWGNASGGTSPSYSADPADKVLGFPAIQFDGSTTYLEWDEIAAMFSGDEPDFTAAVILDTNDVSSVFLGTGNDSNGEMKLNLASNGNPRVTLVDDTNTSQVAGILPYNNEPAIFICKMQDGDVQTFLHHTSDGSEVSASGSIDVASRDLIYGAIGAKMEVGSPGSFFNGSIYRIALVNHALGGDLTGDLTGTQMELLLNEMLRQAPGDLIPRVHAYPLFVRRIGDPRQLGR